jgi:hypothetical protein
MTHNLIKTDQQITAFVLETMQTFSLLSSWERRQLRNQHRRRFVDESLTAQRSFGFPNYPAETMYDNLDFAGG